MCGVCVTVAGALVAASQIVPVEPLNQFSTSSRTLSSFSGSSVSLTSKQRSEVKNLVDRSPGAESITCTGLRLSSASKATVATITKRAKAACDYAKRLNRSLKTSVVTKTTTARSSAGKVTLAIRTPRETSTATPAPLPPSNPSVNYPTNQLSLDAEICKLKENSRMRRPGDVVEDFTGQLEIRGRYKSNAVAFPFAPTTLPTKGGIDVAMVFLDWADSPGTTEDYNYFKAQAKLFEDFFWMVSENKLDMRMTYSDKWFRIPGSYKDFATNSDEEAQRGEAPKKQIFYDAAVAASDAETDYSGIEIVFYAVPRGKSVFANGPHEFNFDYNGYLKTNEGNIYNTATVGDFFLASDGQPPWVYYVHETGHMIGVPHQANEDENKPFTEKYVVNPMGGWDIMSNQGGATRTITSWLRWLAGWITDQQVVCVTKDAVTDNYFKLHPINEVKGRVESLVIKLNDTKALVLESRRHDKQFDIATGNSKDGVLVYVVDATKASAQGNQILLSPRDITKYLEEKNTYPDWRELDAIFFQGNSIVYEGLKIEVVSVGSDGDVVRVTKG